ncbi:MAG: hypothetical protein KBS95_03235 [Alistipes sp.]|nr:hypothetical protein [Candidatus Alistipes equi]
MPNTSYIALRNKFIGYGCFNIYQVLMWDPGFDSNNYTRWCRQGLLVRLRRGWFAFPELLKAPDFARYIAGRIYKPSYISLQTALSFYGMIPEAVTDITCVSTLKTAGFENLFGNYTYKSIKPELFFGFELRKIQDGRTIPFATLEKALLDLLYLYPEYNTEYTLLELRLDEDCLENVLDRDRLRKYTELFKSKALSSRMNTLIKAYGL